jgi:Pyruvate/2-oxoacid:ferredoxin oxidoreductase gamma subunit
MAIKVLFSAMELAGWSVADTPTYMNAERAAKVACKVHFEKSKAPTEEQMRAALPAPLEYGCRLV